MNYTTTIASVLGITAAGFISVWVCDRFVKRRKQTKKMSIVFDDVVNDMETAILLQTPISQKRTRARITSGMIRKWNFGTQGRSSQRSAIQSSGRYPVWPRRSVVCGRILEPYNTQDRDRIVNYISNDKNCKS